MTDFRTNVNSCSIYTHNLAYLYECPKFNWNFSTGNIFIRIVSVIICVCAKRVCVWPIKLQANDYKIDVVIVIFRINSWNCWFCKSVSSIQFLRTLEGMSVWMFFSFFFFFLNSFRCDKNANKRDGKIDLELIYWCEFCLVVLRMYRLLNDLKH